jgi:hypothetical protein
VVSPLARADQDQDQPLVPPQGALEREKKHAAAAVMTHATSATVKGRFSMRARYTHPREAARANSAKIDEECHDPCFHRCCDAALGEWSLI